MTTHTPWGPAQRTTELAPGITEYSTASHGGLHLSPEREAKVRELFPEHRPFCGLPCWYEEDCDWAYVALAWPACFSTYQIRCAFRMVESVSKRSPVDHLTPFLETSHGQDVQAQVSEWETKHAEGWEYCGCGTSNDLPYRQVRVQLRQIGTGKHATAILSDYPDKSFWTAAEIREQALSFTADED